MNGRDCVSMSYAWADGMRTFDGFLSCGFPNCFHMGLTQTGLTANFTYMLDNQAQHVAQLITLVNRRNAKSIEPTAEAEAEWVQLVNGPNMMTKYQDVCTPGYYNGEGTNEGKGFFKAIYPKGALVFYDMLAEWREKGDFAGLMVK